MASLRLRQGFGGQARGLVPSARHRFATALLFAERPFSSPHSRTSVVYE